MSYKCTIPSDVKVMSCWECNKKISMNESKTIRGEYTCLSVCQECYDKTEVSKRG